jgi:hypothetical protein
MKTFRAYFNNASTPRVHLFYKHVYDDTVEGAQAQVDALLRHHRPLVAHLGLTFVHLQAEPQSSLAAYLDGFKNTACNHPPGSGTCWVCTIEPGDTTSPQAIAKGVREARAERLDPMSHPLPVPSKHGPGGYGFPHDDDDPVSPEAWGEDQKRRMAFVERDVSWGPLGQVASQYIAERVTHKAPHVTTTITPPGFDTRARKKDGLWHVHFHNVKPLPCVTVQIEATRIGVTSLGVGGKNVENVDEAVTAVLQMLGEAT